MGNRPLNSCSMPSSASQCQRNRLTSAFRLSSSSGTLVGQDLWRGCAPGLSRDLLRVLERLELAEERGSDRGGGDRERGEWATARIATFHQPFLRP